MPEDSNEEITKKKIFSIKDKMLYAINKGERVMLYLPEPPTHHRYIYNERKHERMRQISLRTKQDFTNYYVFYNHQLLMPKRYL